MQGLDSGHGFDPAKLVAETVTATNEAGLNANTDAPKTTKAGKFAVHSLQFSCRKADIGSILRFYDSVKARAPYLGPTGAAKGGGGNGGRIVRNM